MLTKVLMGLPMLASDFTRNDGLVITGDVSAPTGTARALYIRAACCTASGPAPRRRRCSFHSERLLPSHAPHTGGAAEGSDCCAVGSSRAPWHPWVASVPAGGPANGRAHPTAPRSSTAASDGPCAPRCPTPLACACDSVPLLYLGFGFSIEDKYNTSEFADSYWEPININTRYGGGFGTGVTGSAAGGWSEFDGSGDWGNG